MLFKDFLHSFDLNETNIVLCDENIEELRFYCPRDDDVDVLEIYSYFDVLEAYTSMHSYSKSFSVPCLVVSLDICGVD